MSTITILVARSVGGEKSALAAAGTEFRRRGGRVSTTPTGRLCSVFDSVGEAVEAAVSAQSRVGGHGGLSIGLDIGELAGDEDDLFKVADRVANALAERAAPGQILATHVVEAVLSRTAVEFCDAGDIVVDGVTAPVDVVEVPWTPAAAEQVLRVVVADDAGLIRSGIVQLLTGTGFDVIAEAADLDGLIAAVDADPPDLLVTDIRMPPTNTDEGLRAAVEVRERHPDVAVLVLSQYIEVAAASDLLTSREGGIGYLLKERVSDVDEFVEVCRRVADGRSVIDPIVAEKLMSTGARTDAVERLSERERDVLGLMAQGKSNGAIAAELYVGAKTVETHVRSVFQKLELAETPEGNRRVQAVLEWLRASPSPNS